MAIQGSFSYIAYVFYSRYNRVWIVNTEIGLDLNNSVIKRLWSIFLAPFKLTWIVNTEIGLDLNNSVIKRLWSIFLAPFKLTKCTKLRRYQTCINHRILVTNKFLFQIKVIDSPKCSFCGDTDETIDHILWNCLKTKQFLQELTERFQEMRISLNLNEVTFILGNFPQNTSNRLKFLMLVAKYYISMCKGTNKHLTFLKYKINVQSIFQGQKEMALKNSELQEFLAAWVPYKKLINNN